MVYSRRMACETAISECSTSVAACCRAPLLLSHRVLDRRRRLNLRPCKLQAVPPRLTGFNERPSPSILADEAPKNSFDSFKEASLATVRELRIPSSSIGDRTTFPPAWHELQHRAQMSHSLWSAVLGLGLISAFTSSATAAPLELQQTASVTHIISAVFLACCLSTARPRDQKIHMPI